MTQARTQATPPAPAAQHPQLVVEAGQAANPQAAFDALVAQQRELHNQVSALESSRLSIARALRSGSTRGADRAGLEERLTALDKQIVAGYERLAVANAAVAQASALPGVSVPPPVPPPVNDNSMPDNVAAVSVVFMLCVFLPISIAIARKIWRRSSAAVSALPAELMDRLTRLEESVEAVAIEVERIGEGQRFVTNLFVEGGAPQMLGAGSMQPIEAKQRERVYEKHE